MYIYIYVCLCEWARDVHRKHDGATVPKFSDWLRRRIVSFADFTASTSFTDWNSEFFADSSLESNNFSDHDAEPFENTEYLDFLYNTLIITRQRTQLYFFVAK